MVDLIAAIVALIALYILDQLVGAPILPSIINLTWINYKVLLGILIFFVVGGGIGFAIFRGETRRRILRLVAGGFNKRLNAILRFTKASRKTPEGREPSVFRENRLLLHALVNWTTRFEITSRYWGFVDQALAVGKRLDPEIAEFKDQSKLRKDIIVYRSGGTTSTGIKYVGWNRHNVEVVDLVNKFIELLFKAYVAADYELKSTHDFRVEASEALAIETRASELLTSITRDYDLYKKATKAFGAHHVLNAYRGIILNMSNPAGDVLKHPQKFARPGAEFDDGSRVGTTLGDPIDEVNQYGELVEDITRQRDTFGNLPEDPRKYEKPRKLKNPNDIIDYPNFILLMENIISDWKGLNEDINWGLHHPKSRRVGDYITALGTHIYPEWADKKIPFLGSPTKGNPAFDMRALADPGKNDYWGRERFDSPTLPEENPFPILSALGLKYYLEKRIDRDMIKELTLAQRYKKIYPAPTGVEKKIRTRGEVTVPAATRLGVEEETPKGGG